MTEVQCFEGDGVDRDAPLAKSQELLDAIADVERVVGNWDIAHKDDRRKLQRDFRGLCSGLRARVHMGHPPSRNDINLLLSTLGTMRVCGGSKTLLTAFQKGEEAIARWAAHARL